LAALCFGIGLAIAELAVWWRSVLLEPQGRLGSDFMSFYTGARLLLDGTGASLYDLERQSAVQQALTAPHVFEGGVLPYVNPPILALLLTPLAPLPYDVAFYLWTGCNLLFLTLAVRRLLATFGKPAPTQRITLWLMALTFPPAFVALRLGQNSVLLLFLLAVYLAEMWRGRELRAGLVLSLALFKPQLLAVWLVILLVKRRWRALLGFGAGAAALTGIQLAVVGGSGALAYLDLLAKAAGWEEEHGYAAALTHSWGGFWRLLFPGERALADFLALAAGVATVALVLWVWRGKWWTVTTTFLTGTAVACLATPLVTPHALWHELVFWLPAGYALVRYHRQVSAAGRRTIAALLFIGYAVALAAGALAGLGGIQWSVLFAAGALVTIAWLRRSATIMRSG
jgi:hypothetical protein